jgi:hypothetical protein
MVVHGVLQLNVSSLSCIIYLVIFFIVFIHMHPASHLGPRGGDRANDVVTTTRCSRWTTQGRMDLTSGCSPSEHLPQQTLSKC